MGPPEGVAFAAMLKLGAVEGGAKLELEHLICQRLLADWVWREASVHLLHVIGWEERSVSIQASTW